MTTSPPSEIRGEPRIELRETVLVEVISSTENAPGSVIVCHSMDFSASGLQVVVEDDMPPGSIFRLCIDLTGQPPIFLVAEVMWRRHNKGGSGYRLGFALFDAEGTDIERWRDLMSRLTDTA